MKILFFISRGDTIGGAQTHVLILAKNLLNQGNEVLVCVGGVHSVFCDILLKNQIPFINLEEFKNSFNIFSDLKSFFSLNKILNRYSPDIFSVHSTKANYLARILNFKKKYNLISTIHGWSFTEGTPFFFKYANLFFEKFLGRFSTGFIFVCTHDLQLGKKFKIINDNYTVIYNGVPDFFKSKKIESHDLIKIVMVARFDKQKNQIKLINSTFDIPNIVVEFVGDGPNFNMCKKHVEKLNAINKFIFHGSSNNVKDILSNADIFALISNWEGFPMSTVEAMSMKLPILVSDVGGAGECVINGYNGYKVPSNITITDLKNTIQQLSFDKQLLLKMGNNSRNLYLDKFTEFTMVDETEKYFKKFIL